MMKPLSTAVLCYFILLPSLSASETTSREVEARLTSQSLIEIEPGRIVTQSYLVSNNTDHEVEVVESITLPPGWRPVVSFGDPLRLGAGERRVRLVAFAVPIESPAGRYEIEYLIVGRTDPRIRATASSSVVVLPVVKIDSQIEYKPEAVIAGSSYEVGLRLANKGNATAVVGLQTHGTPEYPTSMEPSQVVLDPGTERVAKIVVTTSATLRTKTDHVLDITAETAGGADGTGPTTRTVVVAIVPRQGDERDRWNRVPGHVRFLAVGENDENGVQVEYSGHGSLDELGGRRLEFLFRGPDVQDRSVFGTRDELRLRYSDRFVDVHLGDRAYALSPLSEALIYGRGAEASVHPEALDLGAFYLETRWDTPQEREVGSYVSYRLSDRLRIKGNFLHKQKDESLPVGGYDASIYSIQSSVRGGPRLNLSLESAYSVGDKNGRVTDQAHRVALDGRPSKRSWYTFESIYAGADFLGYYTDVLTSSGTVVVPLYRSLRGNLSYRLHEENLESDPTRKTAATERSYRSEMSYPFSFGTVVSLDYETLRRKDELGTPRYHYDEDTWGLGLGQTFRAFGVQTFSERGVFTDRLAGTNRRDLERYRIYAYCRPTMHQDYALYATIGHNAFTGNPERSKSVGVSSALEIMRFLRWSVNYQKNNFDAERTREQDQLYSNVDIHLPKDHSLTLTARWLTFGGGNETEYSFVAAYTIPLSLPVTKDESFGVLKGRVLDADKAGAVPLRNVILSAGESTAVTDRVGEFIFPALKPGTYSLEIDPRSMGLGRVASEHLPMTVEISGGKTAVREIAVLRASKISGKVALYTVEPSRELGGQGTLHPNGLSLLGSRDTRDGAAKKRELREVAGASQILVEILKGNEVLRQTTDEKGRFSFDGIRPGAWELRVYEYNLPPHHALEQAIFQVPVIKGEEKEVTVRIVPRPRAIQMIEDGVIK